MKIKFILIWSLLLTATNISAQEKPKITEFNRIRLAEAFRIADSLGKRIWSNWDKAPFAVLLVTPENEFLIRHPNPSKDFALIGYDSLLESNVYFRRRTQRTDFLATFPAVGAIATIVVGEAENTSQKTSTPWIVTLMHEHFNNFNTRNQIITRKLTH